MRNPHHTVAGSHSRDINDRYLFDLLSRQELAIMLTVDPAFRLGRGKSSVHRMESARQMLGVGGYSSAAAKIERASKAGEQQRIEAVRQYVRGERESASMTHHGWPKRLLPDAIWRAA